MRQLRKVALLTGGALMAAGAVSTAASPAQAAVACSATYTLDGSWQGGFQGSVKFTNTGDPLTNWTTTWSYADGQKITQLWNGTFTQTGSAVSVKDAGWNGSVATGGTASFGFLGTATGANSIPTAIAVNGVTCGGGPGTNAAPTVALTSPAAGATYNAPGTIPLTATAADSDGTIAKVEYYSNTTLVATSTASPFSASWANVPAGSYSITAKAYDNLGLATTSAPVGVTVLAGPTVKATPSTMSVGIGRTVSYTVALSQAPTANVSLATSRASGTTNLSVTTGASLTFTPSNWSTPQTVTLTSGAGGTPGTATFTTSGPGYAPGTVTVTELAAGTSEYDERFLTMYNKLHDPANGYFSPTGVPYHSIETLMVEAPDQGHETTSEAFSYWMWVEATYGRITGNWDGYNNSWAITEKYIIPPHADQPTNSGYNASDPATYAPESDNQSDYPAKLDNAVPVGADPIAGELKTAYGTDDIYGMHWLLDVDNVYGFGRCGDGTTKPAYINTFQRGSSESTWETIPQPSCDTFKHGGPNGYLDLFTGDASYAKQWKYTNAPDADARAVQVAYWADKWATAQGKQSAVSASVAKAAKMGDYLRYAMFDKYFKKIGNCVGPSTCAAGTGKNSEHYLISWYYAWGGSLDTSNAWAWRIGDGASHQGYQNPLAAYALSQVSTLKPKSTTGAADWATSLTRQLEFYQWLQSADGAIAGGATNSWQGAYASPPAGSPTFYGMAYDPKPVWHDPESNKWFGFQAWSMERVAEYYYATGNAKAKSILDKWVRWALANSSVAADGSYQIPNDLTWSGKPDTWNASNPGSNAGLQVTVANKTNDIGVAGSFAKVLTYYAAKSGDAPAKAFAKSLLDGIWANNQDAMGVSVTETRTDYSRFNEPVYVPASFSGTMPNGDRVASGATFTSIRSWYKNDPSWAKVQTYLDGGAAPKFNYHRFWAQSDVATAMAVYGELFP
jgi:hypothetical protein